MHLKKMSKFFIIFLCFMLAQAKPNGGGSPAFFSISGGTNTNNFSGSMTMNGTAETSNYTNSTITNNGKIFFLDLWDFLLLQYFEFSIWVYCLKKWFLSSYLIFIFYCRNWQQRWIYWNAWRERLQKSWYEA